MVLEAYYIGRGWFETASNLYGRIKYSMMCQHAQSPPPTNAASSPDSVSAKRRVHGKPDLDLDEDATDHDLGEWVDHERRQSGLDEFPECREDATGAWDVYVTNIDDVTAVNAREWANRYANRWAIESEYRVIKKNFLAKTSTRDYSTRVLYWLLAVTLYNAWVLLDLLLWAERDGSQGGEYAIPSSSFGDVLKRTGVG